MYPSKSKISTIYPKQDRYGYTQQAPSSKNNRKRLWIALVVVFGGIIIVVLVLFLILSRKEEENSLLPENHSKMSRERPTLNKKTRDSSNSKDEEKTLELMGQGASSPPSIPSNPLHLQKHPKKPQGATLDKNQHVTSTETVKEKVHEPIDQNVPLSSSTSSKTLPSPLPQFSKVTLKTVLDESLPISLNKENHLTHPIIPCPLPPPANSRQTPSKNCAFCRLWEAKATVYPLYISEHCFAFLSHTPNTKGHFLIVPRRHVPTVNAFVVDSADNSHTAGGLNAYSQDLAFMQRVFLVARVVLTGMVKTGWITQEVADTYTLIQNNDYGQSVDHTHFHILPGGIEEHHSEKYVVPDHVTMEQEAAAVRAKLHRLQSDSQGHHDQKSPCSWCRRGHRMDNAKDLILAKTDSTGVVFPPKPWSKNHFVVFPRLDHCKAISSSVASDKNDHFHLNASYELFLTEAIPLASATIHALFNNNLPRGISFNIYHSPRQKDQPEGHFLLNVVPRSDDPASGISCGVAVAWQRTHPTDLYNELVVPAARIRSAIEQIVKDEKGATNSK